MSDVAIHAANLEGTRLCGATGGMKTVFRHEATSVINCHDCRWALGWPVIDDEVDVVEAASLVEVIHAGSRIDIRAELDRIGNLVEQALRSLDDEHEADFSRDILELHTRAAACLHVVATW